MATEDEILAEAKGYAGAAERSEESAGTALKHVRDAVRLVAQSERQTVAAAGQVSGDASAAKLYRDEAVVAKDVVLAHVGEAPWRGEWAIEITYAAGDGVSRGGNTYRAVAASQGIDPLDDVTDDTPLGVGSAWSFATGTPPGFSADVVEVRGNAIAVGVAKTAVDQKAAVVDAQATTVATQKTIAETKAAEAAADAVAAAASEAAAAGHASAAELAAAAAEAFGTLYASTAAGIAATVDGEFFLVVGDGTNTYALLYENESEVATLRTTYPSKTALDTAVAGALAAVAAESTERKSLLDKATRIVIRDAPGTIIRQVLDTDGRLFGFTTSDGIDWRVLPDGSFDRVTTVATGVGIGAERMVIPGVGEVQAAEVDLDGRALAATTRNSIDLVSGVGGMFRPAGDLGWADYDVVIYKASIAALMAAQRLARYTVDGWPRYRVLIVEPTGQIGGMTVSGIVYADFPSPHATTPDVMKGLTNQFFLDIGKHYSLSATLPKQEFEPQVAMRFLQDLLVTAGADIVFDSPLDRGMVMVRSGRITAIKTARGMVRGRYFLDCSYEGDLMAAAGVPFAVGRESAATYGEDQAGYQIDEAGQLAGFSINTGYLIQPIDPELENGDADGLVQPMTFRTPITREASRVPFHRPTDYDASRYALVPEVIDIRNLTAFGGDASGYIGLNVIPSSSGDVEPNFNTNQIQIIGQDFSGPISAEYVTASLARRREIVAELASYCAGLFYFLANDASVRSDFRTDAQRYGYISGAYPDSPHGDGMPYEPYVREGRRMLGDVVLTQTDLYTDKVKATVVARWSYRTDAHAHQLLSHADGTTIIAEGRTGASADSPYDVPAEVIIPPAGSVENLLVPVCGSYSHVAWMSARMEPLFGMLGEVAGEIAAQALERGATAVQAYDYDDLVERLAALGLSYDD